ncbi:RNA-directed DNA polymerase (reverse transcriptase)-related family protein [Rhynchospora pubera]|uniref:RNA-directed DNA polymerase (Reverse transcriptase)-related family protein n=1 Tax=Rhynchospora pubera TaxID=906938 RepID=A0AAV8CQU9_9POAL|nr:RNA-directed DNA polymerase (reverse transcriptase)-related family protein [Rhynchospora pubera]
MLQNKQSVGKISGLSIARGAPPISSLMYADDLLICGLAEGSEVQQIKQILDKFCAMSGQLIGAEKSRIWFSKRTSPQQRTLCTTYLQEVPGECNQIYLGVPIQPSKRCHYNYLVEKVDAKLNVWKAKMLSPAAKVVLLKAVIEPLLLYSMGAGSIPDSEKITVPKCNGGLGLVDAKVLNRAMLFKMLWRLAAKEDDQALWVKVLSAKYLSRSTLWLAKTPSRCSKLWRTLLECRNDMQPHIKWFIGVGNRCSLIGDPWHPFWLHFEQQTVHATNLTIAQVIHPPTGQWNTSLLISALDFHAALYLVCAYPEPPLIHSDADRLIFTPATSGVFSFKAACRLLSTHASMMAPSSPSWKEIWHSPGILLRIRVFLWRLLHDVVPVSATFARRLSTTMLANLLSWLRTFALPRGIPDLFSFLVEQLDQRDFMIFANHLWAFWKARCKQVYEGKQINGRQVNILANSYTFLADLTRTSLRKLEGQQDCNLGRSVPTEGNICKMDASFSDHGDSGWVYTLYTGGHLLHYGVLSGPASSPLHAEVNAMLASLIAASAAAYFKRNDGLSCFYVPREQLQQEHLLANYARIHNISTIQNFFPSFPPM